MNDQSISFILDLPTDMKIKILRDSLKEDKFGIFFQMSKVLLDAPISEGGLPTEVISAIHDEYMNNNQGYIEPEDEFESNGVHNINGDIGGE